MRRQFGPFDLPPLPDSGETVRQQANRKARVWFQGKNAFGLFFGELARHLGKVEASQLLLEWAEETAKRHKAKGRGRAKPRTWRSRQAEDDYLLQLAEDMESPRRAAEFACSQHHTIFGVSVEAIEQRIKLLRARRQNQA
jgi:hypothetical protein